MVLLLQLFFGMALGYAGTHMLFGSGSLSLLGILACFTSIVLLIKASTRLFLWLVSIQRKGPCS